jgi:hypothetical protein
MIGPFFLGRVVTWAPDDEFFFASLTVAVLAELPGTGVEDSSAWTGVACNAKMRAKIIFRVSFPISRPFLR